MEVKLHRVQPDVKEHEIVTVLGRKGFVVKGKVEKKLLERKSKQIDIGVRALTLELNKKQSEEDIPEQMEVNGLEILIRHRNDKKWCDVCKDSSHFSKFCQKQTCTY